MKKNKVRPHLHTRINTLKNNKLKAATTDSNSSSSVSIIIVNYNTSFWLKQTLTTLFAQSLSQAKHSYQVFVVDNSSSDNSVSMVKQNFPQVTLHQLETNIGYAAANNYILNQLTTEYALLLNSDIECTEATNFDILVDFANNHPQVAVVTPHIQLGTGAIDPACHRGEPTLWTSFCYFSGLATLFPKTKLFAQYHQTYKDFSSIHPIDACSGAAMLVKASAIQEVGVFDERFFMYAEDLDWCKRFREKGWQIVYHPGVSLTHHKHKSGIKSESKAIAQKTNHFFYDTMLQYFDKHYRAHYPSFVRAGIKYVLELKKGTL